MFSNVLKAGANRLSGRTDYLEAVAAIGVLGAAAEGGVDDSEAGSILETLSSIDAISSNFSSDQIEQTVEKYVSRAKNAVGRAGLRKEVADMVNKELDIRESIWLSAKEVVANDGISPKEEQFLRSMSDLLKVNYDKLINL